MEKFVWSDEYRGGIPGTDNAHKEFFNIVNDLIDLLAREEARRETLITAMGRIGNYASTHFKEEEDMFDVGVYEDAPRHVAAHDLFRRRVEHYLRSLDDPEADIRQLASEIATFSIYWLSDHILLMDKQYTVFLKNKKDAA